MRFLCELRVGLVGRRFKMTLRASRPFGGTYVVEGPLLTELRAPEGNM